MYALPTPDYTTKAKYRAAFEQVNDEARTQVLQEFLPILMNRYRKLLIGPPRDYEARIGEADVLLQSLQKDGCVLARIGADAKASLSALVLPVAEEMESRLATVEWAGFKERQLKFEPDSDAKIFSQVDEVLAAGHIYDVCAAYARRPIKLARLALQVNTDRLTAMKYGTVGEDGLPSPVTRYFHIDSDGWPWLKVLIYLEPVGPDQGPFRYVVGSHRWTDPFELAIRKTTEKMRLDAKSFAALPEPFRLKAEFGDETDPATPKAERLLKAERALCDGESDLILFDNNGVHRGGFVRKGRRYMLQCAFDPAS